MGAFTDTAKHLVREISDDDLLGLAAELAYRFLFALFPLLIFVAAVGGFASTTLGIENPTDQAMEALEDALPPEAEETVADQLGRVLEQQNPGLLSAGLVLALWAASGGMKAVMKAMNRAYDVEESRPFIRKNIVALALTILLGISVIGGFALLTVGQFFAGELADLLGLEAWAATIIQVVQGIVAIALLLVGVAFLYWAAPNTDVPFRWVSPGAILFVLAWFVATVGFGFYVANFGAYADTYGALGGVIVLMLWFYITGLVLLVGAELNAVLTKRAAPEALKSEGRDVKPDEERARREHGAGTSNGGTPADTPTTERQQPPSRTGAVLGAAVGGAAALRALGRQRDDTSNGERDARSFDRSGRDGQEGAESTQ